MLNTKGSELRENRELEYEIWGLSDENWDIRTEIWVSSEPSRSL